MAHRHSAIVECGAVQDTGLIQAYGCAHTGHTAARCAAPHATALKIDVPSIKLTVAAESHQFT